MRLILVRHGKTLENEKGLIHGVMHGKLSSAGISQARAIARRLAAESIDAIYSSDLRRAKDTAKIIARYHKCPLRFTKDIRERDYGILEGKRKEDAKGIEGYPDTIPKGESLDRLLQRAKIFLKGIMKRHKEGTVLIVGHNRINLAIIAAAKGRPASHIYRQRKQRHDEVKEILVHNH